MYNEPGKYSEERYQDIGYYRNIQARYREIGKMYNVQCIMYNV